MNDPDYEDAFLTQTRIHIANHGQSVVGVMAGTSSFYYTVGRHQRGLPELILMMPLEPTSARDLLNVLDRQMPVRVPDGSLISLGGDHPVEIADVGPGIAQLAYTFVASRINGTEDYAVQQIILCDPAGRFPPDAAAPYSFQKVLRDDQN
jgi:Domain of unknown function (DUF4262)